MPIRYCMVGLLRRDEMSSSTTSCEIKLDQQQSIKTGQSSETASLMYASERHSCTLIGEYFLTAKTNSTTNPYTTQTALRTMCIKIGEKIQWNNHKKSLTDESRTNLRFNCQVIDHFIFIACTDNDFPIRISFGVFDKLKTALLDQDLTEDLAFETKNISKMIQDEVLYSNHIENDKSYQIRKKLMEIQDLMPPPIIQHPSTTMTEASMDELRASTALFRVRSTISRKEKIIGFIQKVFSCMRSCCCGGELL